MKILKKIIFIITIIIITMLITNKIIIENISIVETEINETENEIVTFIRLDILEQQFDYVTEDIK